MNRSAYTVRVVPGFVCLTDLDWGKTITNDADEVIADLIQAGYDLTANRVIYCDTDNVWDELVVRDGKFADFRLLRAPNVLAAISAAQEP